MTSPTYVGIDIGKAELVVATSASILCKAPNDGDGHRQLVKRLRALENPTVVVESTGCYGREIALALGAAGIPIAIVQPGRVRHFAKSRGVLAKTDSIDARLIAQFGEANRPRCWTAPQAEITRLRALVDRRDQIIAQRLQEQGHLESCPDQTIAREIRRKIARLKKDEQAYTDKIARVLSEDARLRRLSEALQAEEGVGLQTAAALLAYLPELGTLNRQQVAALVGLAPFNRDSGTAEGKRAISGGRRRLRRALYMAAITAARFNTWIGPMYRRLVERGKLKKVALVACGRKLAIRLNSIAAKVLAESATAPASATAAG